MKTNVSWRILKANLEGEYILKTSSEDEDERRLQDIFKTSSSRRMFAGSDDCFYTGTSVRQISTKMYSEPCLTSKMDRFVEMMIG